MKKSIGIVITFILFASVIESKGSQDTTASSPTRDEMSKLVREFIETDTTSMRPLFEALINSAPISNSDDTTKAYKTKAIRGLFEYLTFATHHRKNVFAWQLFSTKIIFYAVLILVFIGIFFSGIQFYKSIRRQSLPGADDKDDPITEFEASTSGIKVSSPVLGVIILVISLAFFYLYLVYVYPITEIF